MNWKTILPVALVLLLGFGGYMVVGSPGLKSAPSERSAPHPDLTPEAEQASKELLNNFGDVRAWLTLSDALIRTGRTESAVSAMQSGLEAIPGNADLWVQMGVALVAHADGEVVPAARLAFDRAARLAPDHPAPAYFLGLAWLQSGDVDNALKTWGELRARSADDAPWVSLLDRQIAAAHRMRDMGVGQAMMPVPPDGEGSPGT
ncbi:tetratricopeptide repeat protein [Sandaracinobacter neustonicus]|uniref:Tetratricopeptide repeat protein n=1 Tax=Sandaracinobacter neustonicus TaxID=1715348 RepID=A0A501XTB6_9SPHN|nr:tetratricopeptide repeat protein [Sandaracinobacter neustonicus]TPE63695.1 tetratricopeptide repeat protein [Sandaracinobacter neustonicus]